MTSKGSQVQSLSLPPFPPRNFESRASGLAHFCFQACVAPGQLGNPGGRPGDEHRVADLARGYTIEAIETLAE